MHSGGGGAEQSATCKLYHKMQLVAAFKSGFLKYANASIARLPSII